MKKLFFYVYLGITITNSAHDIVLTAADIQAIYAAYVEPNNTQEYKERYRYLPLHKNNIPHWDWKDKDFPRIIALLEFERFIVAHTVTCEKGLAINTIDPEWHYINAQQIVQTNYEQDPHNHDLHVLNIPDVDFDFVMANQTFEHVYDPLLCLRNIYKHMRNGGILYFNVPANNIPHSTPFHYYTGYTPVGIGALVKAAGFTILSIGQWGNLDYLKKLHETLSWPDYTHFNNSALNDLERPVITWVFAQKLPLTKSIGIALSL
jgi:hypothetical protein